MSSYPVDDWLETAAQDTYLSDDTPFERMVYEAMPTVIGTYSTNPAQSMFVILGAVGVLLLFLIWGAASRGWEIANNQPSVLSPQSSVLSPQPTVLSPQSSVLNTR